MTPSAAIKQLETVIGKLSHLNYHIDGNQLQSAIREVAHVKERLLSKSLKTRKV